MEINSAKPAANEVASVTAAASEQVARFNDQKAIEAQSDVKSEAVFFSPVIKIDKDTQTTVIQYRDPTTGAVTKEYPDKAKLDAYQHAQETAKPGVSAVQNGNIKIISDNQPADVKVPGQIQGQQQDQQGNDPVVNQQA
jgi:hypothetical protein